MKRVYLKPPPSKMYLNNGVFAVNNGHNIFWHFDKLLLKEKIQLQTIDLDNKDDGEKYVYSDIPYPWEINLWQKIFRHKIKNILFCFESPIISPFSHMKPFHKFFYKIYTWDDHLIDNKKYFKLNVPQLSSNIKLKPKKFRDKKFLVLINAKKSLPLPYRILSLSNKNLFNERLKAIEYCDTHIPHNFSLYGKGWDKPDPFKPSEKLFGFTRYKTYKGEILSNKKIEILSQFKFALCFENTSADGYITEKIFDAFKARVVPIYLGASNIHTFINKRCFIDFRKFSNYEKLISYLQNITEKQYNNYLYSIEQFLNSKDIQKKWFEDEFKRKFLESVQ